MKTTKLAKVLRPITRTHTRALHQGSIVIVLGDFLDNEGRKTLTVELKDDPTNIFTILEEFIEYIEDIEVVEESKTLYQKTKALVLKIWGSIKKLFTSKK